MGTRFVNTFNALPPKAQYLTKVRMALTGGASCSEKELIFRTGLTKTQLLCAVQALQLLQEVDWNNETRKYQLLKTVGTNGQIESCCSNVTKA